MRLLHIKRTERQQDSVVACDLLRFSYLRMRTISICQCSIRMTPLSPFLFLFVVAVQLHEPASNEANTRMMTRGRRLQPTGDAVYDALRMKYDWNAATPPPGYVYGVGRGALPFSTSVEAAAHVTKAAADVHLLRDQIDILTEGDQVEAEMRAHSYRKRQREGTVNAITTHTGPHHQPAKLSLADIETLKGVSADAQRAALAQDTIDVDEVEREEMSSTDIQAHLKPLQFTSQSVSVVMNDAEKREMRRLGLDDDPKAWITRSRLSWNDGFKKRALRELKDGCKIAGKHPNAEALWLERCSRLEEMDEMLEMGRVLHEAVQTITTSESLWLKYIDTRPTSDERSRAIHDAAKSISRSEKMWEMLFVAASPDEKRNVVDQFLSLNGKDVAAFTRFERMWGRVAQSKSVEKGRDILRAVSRRNPQSFKIHMELAWFEEGARTAAAPVNPVNPVDSIDRLLCGDRVMVDITSDADIEGHVRRAINCTTASTDWLPAVHESVAPARDAPRCALWLVLLKATPASTAPSSASVFDVRRLPKKWLSDILQLLSQPSADANSQTKISLTLLLILLTSQLLVLQLSHTQQVANDAASLLDGDAVSNLVDLLLNTEEAKCSDGAEGGEALRHMPVRASSDAKFAAPADDEEDELLPRAPNTPPPRSGGSILMRLLVQMFAAVSRLPDAAKTLNKIAYALHTCGQSGVALSLLRPLIHSAIERRTEMDESLVLGYIRLLSATQAPLGDIANLLEKCSSQSVCLMEKYLIHLRATHLLTLDACETAITTFPKSVTLWTLYLRFVLLSAPVLDDGVVRVVRDLYGRALSGECCGDAPAMWALCAEVEGVNLSHHGTARRLLSDAMERFGPKTVIRNGRPERSQMTSEQLRLLLPILLAQFKVDWRCHGSAVALRSLTEVQREPGVVLPDAITALIIAATPISARQKVADDMKKRLSSNVLGPLTALEMCKLSFSAGDIESAASGLNAALRRDPDCGDLYALKLSFLRSDKSGEFIEHLADVKKQQVNDTAQQRPLVDIIDKTVAEAESQTALHGRRWATRAEERDPANVQVVAYRDSIRDMLNDIAETILKDEF